MLHVAPEPCFEVKIRQRLGENYITADLVNPRAMVRMDITDIHYPDDSFDIIFCNHVLEHINDDRRAMRELHRVLKHDGCAFLLVPITAAITFEDPSVTDPAERRRLFGQEGHVRRYGPDYVERLRELGFEVKTIYAKDLLTPEQSVRVGIKLADRIFCCTKNES